MFQSFSSIDTTSRGFRVNSIDLSSLRGGQVSRNNNLKLDEAAVQIFLKTCSDLLSANSLYIPIKVLLLVNLAVFIMWRVCPTEFMVDHFIDSPKNRRNGRWWCGMGASISHIDFAHLAGNIGAYALCGPPTLRFLGSFKFVTMMLISAYLSPMIAGWLSKLQHIYKSVDNGAPTLGFSGLVATLMVTNAISEIKDYGQVVDHRKGDVISHLKSVQWLCMAATGDCFGLVAKLTMPIIIYINMNTIIMYIVNMLRIVC